MQEQYHKKILFLDDMVERIPLLRCGEEIHYVRNSEQFMKWLEENGTPDIISFDHDLAEQHYAGTSTYGEAPSTEWNGEQCAAWAIDKGYIPTMVIVHYWNSAGARKIADRFITAGCGQVTVRPFNPRKPHLWLD